MTSSRERVPDSEILAAIKAQFQLEGDRLVRRASGMEVGGSRRASSYRQAHVDILGRRTMLRVHRIKFALRHGYLPPRVDHRDRNIGNNALDNLRPANASLNAVNHSRKLKMVRRRKSGRWSAYAVEDGRQVGLGTYGTEEEARAVSASFRRQLYGEFFDQT